ncbi:MAG: hypothetical protein BRD42_05390 [Bacteroidetes bacterium QS_3_64_15]|nr:MAG: hypothetical protein BRD42_05390 [Bacteroidetes bacterium QS_3_64_15]
MAHRETAFELRNADLESIGQPLLDRLALVCCAVDMFIEAVDALTKTGFSLVNALREAVFEVVQGLLRGAGHVEVRQKFGNAFGLLGATRAVLLRAPGGP